MPHTRQAMIAIIVEDGDGISMDQAWRAGRLRISAC
jgi:hypothetical protein